MPIATLNDVLPAARASGYAVAGLVVLGWEDARAYVTAAEAIGAPVILQAGPGCRAHTPLRVLGAMFRALGENAGVPVVAHLDHSRDVDECRHAIDHGFSAVMFDGSRLPLEENIAATRRAIDVAHPHGVSVEGELGFVGYDGGEASARTDPADAARFACETGVDALAVSVGNVHLQRTSAAEIDVPALERIHLAVPVPLVIHGGSGVPSPMRQRLARAGLVSKFNIGTELRMAFGAMLRATLAASPDAFDRNEIMREVEAPLAMTAQRILAELYLTRGLA